MKIHKKIRAGDYTLVGTIIAAVCIVIYLGAMIQAAVRLYLSVEQHRNTAEQEFNHIATLALATGGSGFMDENFKEIMTSALAFSNSIEALIISGPEGEYAFERQKGNAIVWINNSPRFINKFSFSNQNYLRPLPIQNLRNVNIKAVASAFNYAEFSKILKETLILILIGFVLAFFTMLLQLLLGKSGEKTYSYNPARKSTEPQEDSEDGPKGLFSTRSNIGWEEYTKDRLDAELHRCASTEKDLTLILMEFAGKINDTQFKQAAEDAVHYFTSRDLLFECGNQGIIVIYPGIDLETGLDKARKFHKRISEKLLYKHKPKISLYIGLTSRSERLLNAGRMLMEVMEALQKAKSDSESSIIAFKSDPDKYRKFIASQNPRKT